MGPGFHVEVRVADFLHRKRKQVWIALTNATPEARLFDFDGSKVTTVYDSEHPSAGRVYPTPKIRPNGAFEIFEELDQDYDEDVLGPGLFNPQTNLTERLLRWTGTAFVPVDVLKLPRAQQTPRAIKVHQYESLLHRLIPGHSPAQIRRSLSLLKAAGRDAFPVLLNHLEDETPVDSNATPEFIHENAADGSQTPAPTMAEACFEILREVIEGKWPERFAAYHMLSRINLRPWLESKLQHWDLKDLQIQAAEDAVRFAKEEPNGDEVPQRREEAMEFLTHRLDGLNEAKPLPRNNKRRTP